MSLIGIKDEHDNDIVTVYSVRNGRFYHVAAINIDSLIGEDIYNDLLVLEGNEEIPLRLVVGVTPNTKPINIVFDGPPDHDGPRLVEVETDDGKSISIGKWKQVGNYWHLRIEELPVDDE